MNTRPRVALSQTHRPHFENGYRSARSSILNGGSPDFVAAVDLLNRAVTAPEPGRYAYQLTGVIAAMHDALASVPAL